MQTVQLHWSIQSSFLRIAELLKSTGALAKLLFLILYSDWIFEFWQIKLESIGIPWVVYCYVHFSCVCDNN